MDELLDFTFSALADTLLTDILAIWQDIVAERGKNAALKTRVKCLGETMQFHSS